MARLARHGSVGTARVSRLGVIVVVVVVIVVVVVVVINFVIVVARGSTTTNAMGEFVSSLSWREGEEGKRTLGLDLKHDKKFAVDLW
jgi:hypothetical protein